MSSISYAGFDQTRLHYKQCLLKSCGACTYYQRNILLCSLSPPSVIRYILCFGNPNFLQTIIGNQQFHITILTAAPPSAAPATNLTAPPSPHPYPQPPTGPLSPTLASRYSIRLSLNIPPAPQSSVPSSPTMHKPSTPHSSKAAHWEFPSQALFPRSHCRRGVSAVATRSWLAGIGNCSVGWRGWHFGAEDGIFVLEEHELIGGVGGEGEWWWWGGGGWWWLRGTVCSLAGNEERWGWRVILWGAINVWGCWDVFISSGRRGCGCRGSWSTSHSSVAGDKERH